MYDLLVTNHGKVGVDTLKIFFPCKKKSILFPEAQLKNEQLANLQVVITYYLKQQQYD